MKGVYKMDFSKIVSNSIDKTLKDVSTGKIKNDFIFDNSKSEAEVHQNQLLMNYSITLLQTYHEELCKELANHGIQI